MKADRFIALDIGEDYIRMGEFIRQGSGELHLLAHGSTEIKSGGRVEMAKEAVVATALKRLLDEKKPAAKKAIISVEGKSVFSRLVKLPPVTADKIEETIRHEAVQNIPFPVDEVVWDAHVVDGASPEPEVLLVAAKAELVDGLVHSVRANGLSIEQVVVAPVALANAVRFIYPDLTKPVLLVDIGAHSTNLVFVDGARTFFRTVSVASTGVSQLAEEISRSITFYRSQPNGHAPQQILLTGEVVDVGEFQTRMGIPSIPFDLQRILPLDTVGLAVLAGIAASSGAAANLDINLTPAFIQRERAIQQRQPWWFACAATGLLLAGVWMWSLNETSALVQQENDAVLFRIRTVAEIEEKLLPLEEEISRMKGHALAYSRAIGQRDFMLEVLEDIRGRLPDGMFILSSEPLRIKNQPNGIRVAVVSYLDKERAGADSVKQLRDSLRKSDLFSSETNVSSRPTKGLFARQFMLDIYFEEGR